MDNDSLLLLNYVLIFFWKYFSYQVTFEKLDRQNKQKLKDNLILEVLALGGSYTMLDIAISMISFEYTVPFYIPLIYTLISDINTRALFYFKKDEIEQKFNPQKLPERYYYSLVYSIVFMVPLSIFFSILWILILFA